MEYSDTNTLYNISSGGTGGFVVPKDKMNKWKESIKVRTQHSDNPNFSGFSDQELVDIACEYFKSIGYIAGSKVWARFAKENGYPQTFSKNRFGGKYDNFAKRVQEKTNLTYAKHRKSEDHKQKLRECSKSKAWVTDGSISKYINKNELDLYIKKGFRRGRHA
jgi:hypothetical protein